MFNEKARITHEIDLHVVRMARNEAGGGSGMKYELGDKVRIKNYWKRQSQTEQLERMGISELEDHLMSDEMVGEYIRLDKYKKEPIEEVGYICGIREFKTSYDLMFVSDEPYRSDGVRQVQEQLSKTYLVATRMNCLRRVSFEDIEYIGR